MRRIRIISKKSVCWSHNQLILFGYISGSIAICPCSEKTRERIRELHQSERDNETD